MSSVPPPPGVDIEEYRQTHSEFRRNSREYERDRDRHDRGREEFRSRYDKNRDSNGSSSDRSYSKDIDERYDRRSHRDHYRDRSRERDRHRDRERHRDHSRDRDKERERERDWERLKDSDWRDEIPHNTILVKGLATHLAENDLRSEITRYSLYPKEVIVMRRKSTGESRGFAFIEFRLLSDAVRWKELTQGVISFGECRATLHYVMPRDLSSDRSYPRNDWNCSKCGVSNFRRRDSCFKCNSMREDSETDYQGGEGSEEISHTPSSTLLFRNLDILTTEERVLSMLGQLTVLPIKNLKVAKDSLTNTSRGFAYVELHSISEATQLHDLLHSMAGNFYVDGRQVTVSYSRHSLSSLNATASSNAANAALAAAQWTNQNSDNNSSTYNSSSIDAQNTNSNTSQSSSIGDASYAKYPAPNVSSYQYDETSGYYYDSVTGFYYDPNSHYYYNPESQQYMYWNAEQQTYVPVQSSESAVIEAQASTSTKSSKPVISSSAVITAAPTTVKKETEMEKTKEKVNPQDKVKIAKKVAKDMEKWAKTLNQKKENARLGNVNMMPPSQPPEPQVSPSVLLENQNPGLKELEVKKLTLALSKDKPKDKDSLTLVASYGGESDSEPENDLHDESAKALDLLKAEESKLIDWVKLACLLCKRQFPTKEVLSKHIQLSDLHKQNVDMLRLTKLTPRQLRDLDRKESGYRDRAKERRQKFGQPDVPPPSHLKSKYMKERREAFIPPEEPTKGGIGADNIGNKMLKSMGWTEGQGLGKSGQGTASIIEVEQRVKHAGLGMKGSSYGAGAADSYKDAVRKAMQARYNEIS